MHPPADRTCQTYINDFSSRNMSRCVNEGTHWVKWPGCYCTDQVGHGCDGDFYSWECDGGHEMKEGIAA